MGKVPIFFDNSFTQVSYVLCDKPEKICIDVTISNTVVAAYTGSNFSICLRKQDHILEIPVHGSVDRAIKFQLVAKILRQENIDN